MGCLSVVYELIKGDVSVWNIECGTLVAQGCAWLKDCTRPAKIQSIGLARKGVHW